MIGSVPKLFRAPRLGVHSIVSGLLVIMVIASAGAVPASARVEIPPDLASWVESVVEAVPSNAVATQNVDGGRQLQNLLPKVLSPSDEATYGTIFRTQDASDWATADRAIQRLDDRLLIGQVLAQRYLRLGAHRVVLADLNDWLEAYPDHADAAAIYALATTVAGRGRGNTVTRPLADSAFSGDDDGGISWSDVARHNYHKLASHQRTKVERFMARVRGAVARGSTATAQKLLETDNARALLRRSDLDGLRALLGLAYFRDGRDDLALSMTETVASGSPHDVPLAAWVAGLASWRQGHVNTARQHFQRLAQNPNASSWMIAAGGYWAARCSLKDRHPEDVNHWLEIAAQHPRAMYGLLARQALGLGLHQNVAALNPNRDPASHLAESPSGRRALALLQVGRKDMAEQQLRRIYPTASEANSRAVAVIASRVGLSQLAQDVEAETPDASLKAKKNFPIPAWNPSGGWRLDRALVLAIVRQESGFNPGAKSPGGARGLMQLMPATAKAISRSSGRGQTSTKNLYQPAVNLMLGQRYLEHLLEDDTINGNMLMLTAAYNVGQGTLQRWLARMDYRDDPLLFLEAIPSSNTRVFVEHVMMNFWAYRMRLNQPSPELESLAAGGWPLYVQLDDHSQLVAQNVSH